MARGQRAHALAHPHRQAFALLGVPDRDADAGQLPGQFVEAVRLRLDQRDTEAAELGLHGRADAVRPEQDQIGLQRQQGFQIELAVAAEGRQVRQRRQARTGVEHADQAFGGFQLEHDLAERRRQRHHPSRARLRGLRQRGAEQQHGEQ